MSKKLNTINLGADFKEKRNLEQGEYYKEFKTLRECYGRWSSDKENIYNYYKNLLNNNADKVEKYGIRSYNGWFIQLHAIVEKDNKRYYLLITKAHNYYVEIGE